MGDPLKKVQPGQRLNIPAQIFNTFIDAARDYVPRRQNQAEKAKWRQAPANRAAHPILWYNDSWSPASG